MTIEYTYPTATELRLIERDLIPVIEDDDPVFFKELFPLEESDMDKLEWEQKDNLTGLQQARGLNGQPSSVSFLGGKRWQTEPGYYGEHKVIDEELLTRKRPYGQLTGVIDLTDEVADAQQHLLQRRVDRQRYLGWAMLTTGQFLVAAPGGGYRHVDTYPLETLSMSGDFTELDSLSDSEPLRFLRLVQLEGRGTSADFGRKSKIYMNQVTANMLLSNKNPNDLGGKYRINAGNTIIGLDDINMVLQTNNLPAIEVYDKGYLNDAGVFVPFIPAGVAVAVGVRPANQKLGAYRMTRNASNPNMEPGSYTNVIDSAAYGQNMPRTVRVEDGHNGGPVIFYPNAVKILDLYTPN